MPDINQKKSQAAKVNSQQGGLHNQRRGGKSIKLQDQLVKLAVVNQGFTINQLAWIAAGFEVDENGYCQPAGLYQQVQDYFNGKRRGCEISYKETELSKHPRARLVYCKAKNNPYTEAGGYGVRPIGRTQASNTADHVKPELVSHQQKPQPEPTKEAQPRPVDTKMHVANLQELLGD